MKKTHALLTVIAVLLSADILIRVASWESAAHAQGPANRAPVQLTASPTDNGNHILFRMWTDGSIDVRLVNPLRTQAVDWPNSDKAGLSFQDGWKVFLVGP